jgi:hypothetical protein
MGIGVNQITLTIQKNQVRSVLNISGALLVCTIKGLEKSLERRKSMSKCSGTTQ